MFRFLKLGKIGIIKVKHFWIFWRLYHLSMLTLKYIITNSLVINFIFFHPCSMSRIFPGKMFMFPENWGRSIYLLPPQSFLNHLNNPNGNIRIPQAASLQEKDNSWEEGQYIIKLNNVNKVTEISQNSLLQPSSVRRPHDEVTQSPPGDVLLRSEIVHLGITILVFGHILSCVFSS